MMKTATCILASMMSLVWASGPAAAETKVFLLAGQSNMVGVGATADLVGPLARYAASQTKVHIWNNNTKGWDALKGGFGSDADHFGPEVGFGYAIREAFPNDDIYLVKYAVSGSLLSDNMANPANTAGTWKPGQTTQNPIRCYPTFKSTVESAMASLVGKNPMIVGMLWMQGESDAYIDADAAAYQANLRSLIAAVRDDFKAPNMAFAIGQITTAYGDATNNGLVRAAQAAIPGEVANTVCFPTEDLPGWRPDGHYKAQGQIDLGSRFAAAFAPKPSALASDEVLRIPLLPPGPGNPRNSEGDFIQLADGRILFIYSHFTGSNEDHGTAHLAGRYSSDGGRTWTSEDVIVVPNEGRQNIMSVSLLRLSDGRIALFYARKNSSTDCRPVMRISTDEAKTWSEPTLCVGDDDIGYYVLNNDRAVQLKTGRIILPLALHTRPAWGEGAWDDRILCYLSDDCGRTWRRSKDERATKAADGKHVSTQEPGVVELKDGRVFLYCRTTSGSQYVSYSSDGGDTWTPLVPSNMRSPCSPATIQRIPKTGDLILVWNDYSDSACQGDGPRTPLRVAISRDEGGAWEHVKTLESDPQGHYCYTAVEFVGENDVLLGYCAGNLTRYAPLVQTQITRFSLDWLYK